MLSQLMMFKASGVDVSDPNNGPGQLSGSQLTFFCSQFGFVSQEQINSFDSCSKESAEFLIAANKACHQDKTGISDDSKSDSDTGSGDSSADSDYYSDSDKSESSGSVDKGSSRTVVAVKKCHKPKTATKDNCKQKNRAEVNGVCGTQLAADCVEQKLQTCDDIEVSIQTCQNKHVLQKSDSNCYQRVKTVCKEQQNDGAYPQP